MYLPVSGAHALFDNMQTMFVLLSSSYVKHLNKHYAGIKHQRLKDKANRIV